MVRLLVGTDVEETSARLADYLAAATDAEDRLCLVNSLVGGDDTSSDEMAGGRPPRRS